MYSVYFNASQSNKKTDPLDSALRAVAPRAPYAIWKSSHYSVLCFDAAITITVSAGNVSMTSDNGAEVFDLSEFDNNPLQIIELEIKKFQATNIQPEVKPVIGYLAYNGARYFEKLNFLSHDPNEADAIFVFYRNILLLDSENNELKLFVANYEDNNFEIKPSNMTTAGLSLDKIKNHISRESFVDTDGVNSPIAYEILYSKEQFSSMVSRALEYIFAGDIFQVVLSNQLQIKTQVSALRTHQYLQKLNPSPFHFLLAQPNFSLVGASPERMLRSKSLNSGQSYLSMRPVAGTYSKGQSLEDIRARAKKLIEDPKEQAEHIMLIDHCRNDLGKISQIGTVSVSDLFTVESYQNIHHIVSEVSSITLNNVTPLQALKEAFPIATLTGTPKIRAMEIINELENHSRGSFGGAVLAISADGSIDSCVTIRSALITKDNATIKVGAGIVADSKAELEYEECLLKAYPMLVALNNAKINHNSTDDDFSNR